MSLCGLSFTRTVISSAEAFNERKVLTQALDDEVRRKRHGRQFRFGIDQLHRCQPNGLVL